MSYQSYLSECYSLSSHSFSILMVWHSKGRRHDLGSAKMPPLREMFTLEKNLGDHFSAFAHDIFQFFRKLQPLMCFIIHSKYFFISDWLQSPASFSWLAPTKYGRRLHYWTFIGKMIGRLKSRNDGFNSAELESARMISRFENYNEQISKSLHYKDSENIKGKSLNF